MCPRAYYAIGRSVEAFIDIIDDPETGTRVRGTVIRVTASTGAQSNITLETFLAEPPTS